MTFADFIYQQQWGILIFSAVLCLFTLINLLSMRCIRQSELPPRPPPVSVLVPARNEDRNIEACVRSLLAQEYPNFEIIVLDDQSEDRTGEILKRLAQEDPRLRILKGEPLPEGWVGKNWACHQLAQTACGTFFLFTDADTRHHPRMLTDTMALALRTNADLLSGVPRQETATWPEVLTVPMVPWTMHTLVPVLLTRALPLPFLARAIGQFMLFRREAYERTGGHAAVRGVVVEDFALPGRAKRFGLRVELVDASTRVVARMYHNFTEAWNGFAKSLFGAFGYTLPIFAFIWLWMFLATWQPWVGLALHVVGHPLAGFTPALALAAILLQFLPWLASDVRFGLPRYHALLFPLTVTIFTAIAIHSAWRHYHNHPLMWKGRAVR